MRFLFPVHAGARPVLIALAFCGLLAACGGGSGDSPADAGGTPPVANDPATVPDPTPTPVPDPVPDPDPAPTAAGLGVNLAPATYYAGDRALMNLAQGGGWSSQRPGISGWQAFDPVQVDVLGNVKSLLPKELANIPLVPPEGVYGTSPTRVRCAWAGTGTLTAGGALSGLTRAANSLEFDWTPAGGPKTQTVWISMSQTDPTDPVRQLDCREKTASTTARFSPAFLETVRGYKVLRFLDWQNTNANATVTWATRSQLSSQNQTAKPGVSVEYMVALANEAGVDPWFTMPWNADEDYQRRFATYVRDNLAPGRKAYVEMSNEVWNWSFPVTTQAKNEGLSMGLATNETEAYLRRYAQKATWMHKIWSQVFASDMKRLVRVIATQNANPWSAEQILKFQDTAQNFDALATAPYFGGGTFSGSRATITDLNNIFAYLDADIDAVLAKAVENKALATRYGKRYIAYEGGQHVVHTSNVDIVRNINRDPRMYTMYQQYLATWKAQIGDTMTLFNSTGPISQFGAWGLREYAGQPIAETPKLRAVRDHVDER